MITDKLNHKWLIWGAAGLAFILLAFLVFILVLWRGGGAAPTESPATDLPQTQDDRLFTPDLSMNDPVAVTPDRSVKKLLVDLEYLRSNTFRVNIENVALTNDAANVEHYKALPGMPYSVIQVRNINNAVIFEQKITLPTFIIADSGEALESFINPLKQSNSRIIIPIPVNQVPAKITISNATGEEIDSRSFNNENLPIENISHENTDASSGNILGIHSANAQSGSTFKIVIISEAKASSALPEIASQTSRMTRTIDPWPHFEGKVEIITLPNEIPLNCRNFSLNDFTYPTCPTFPVTSIVSEQVPDWSTIVVATTVPCNCGTIMSGFPPVVAVGSKINHGVMAHELGHSVAKMADEYFYQFLPPNAEPVHFGPNCFSSQQECEDATRDFPDASCEAGCSGGTNTTWRPASNIMHNTYSPLKFGPLEECLMGQAIASAIGEIYRCLAPSPTSTPRAGNGGGGTYWGWGR